MYVLSRGTYCLRLSTYAKPLIRPPVGTTIYIYILYWPKIQCREKLKNPKILQQSYNYRRTLLTEGQISHGVAGTSPTSI